MTEATKHTGMMPTTLAQIAAARFFQLSHAAANHGGFWAPSPSSGILIACTEIARVTGADIDDAEIALTIQGGPNWYERLALAQPWRQANADAPRRAAWNIRHIAHAATASLAHHPDQWQPCSVAFLIQVLDDSKHSLDNPPERRLNLESVTFDRELNTDSESPTRLMEH